MAFDIFLSSVTYSRSVLRFCLLASAAPAPATTTSADFSLRHNRRAFTREARSPQVRTHTFVAQPPHLRHLALVTRALRDTARSPCLVTPSMRFLFIGSRFTLHASSPRSVALTQLRFTLLTVTSSQRDLHPQVCAHAGHTANKRCLRSKARPASTDGACPGLLRNVPTGRGCRTSDGPPRCHSPMVFQRHRSPPPSLTAAHCPFSNGQVTYAFRATSLLPGSLWRELPSGF